MVVLELASEYFCSFLVIDDFYVGRGDYGRREEACWIVWDECIVWEY